MEVQRLDLVNDTTIVDVRFRVPRHTPAELELATAPDDVVPASQPAVEPTGAVAHEAQTAQSWSGARLGAAHTDVRPRPVETQPITMTPAAQYVTRSAAQSAASPTAGSGSRTASPAAMASR